MEPEERGRRLDILLSHRYPILNRSQWQERIRKGDVLVEDRPCRPSRKVQERERICFQYRKKIEPEVDRNFAILHRDSDILVLDKPGNLPIHPSGTYFKNTLYFLLKEKFGEEFPAHFIHRLDRETSGVILLALHKESASRLQKEFMARRVRKEYLVAVEGAFRTPIEAAGRMVPDERSEIRKKQRFLPCEKTPEECLKEEEAKRKKRGGMKRRDLPDDEDEGEHEGAFARTELFPVQYDGEISLVRARIHTGRMHQIRATLLALGYPVVGDRLYGVDDSYYLKFIRGEEGEEERKRLRIRRTALHSNLLEFTHPGTNERVAFESPLPEEIASLF